MGAPEGPPPFVQLAADETRWRLMRELARSDLRVRELTERVGQPQSAVSYHLGRLRSDGVVSMRNSSADRRDTYYHLELTRCRELLGAAGAALHPALVPAPSDVQRPRRRSSAPVRALFLCTGNSGRSPMAEALLRQAAGPRVEVASAGSQPKQLHPVAARVMRRRGIDLAGRPSRHLREFTGARFDYVITLCDKVREICPVFPGQPEAIHWSLADPAAAGDARAVSAAFLATATELQNRIDYVLARMLPAVG